VYALGDKQVIAKEEKLNAGMVEEFGGKSYWVAAKLREPIGFVRVPPIFQLESPKHRIFIEGKSGQTGFLDNLLNRRKHAKDIHVGLVVVAPGEKFPTTAIDDAAKNQIALAKLTGMRNLVIAVNHMDAQRYSQATFNQMKYELEKYLKEIEYSMDDVKIIPISTNDGENLTENLGKMRWYMGTTILNQPTLIEAIDAADASKVTDLVEDPPKVTSCEVLASAQDDIPLGFSGKFRIVPDNADLHLETYVDATVDDIILKLSMDKGFSVTEDEEPKILRKGQSGILKISLSEPVTATSSYACPRLSRFHCLVSHSIRFSGVVAPEVDRKGLVWRPTHWLERSFFFA